MLSDLHTLHPQCHFDGCSMLVKACKKINLNKNKRSHNVRSTEITCIAVMFKKSLKLLRPVWVKNSSSVSVVTWSRSAYNLPAGAGKSVCRRGVS